ncbi:hypothetical protein FPOAC2_03734 [Fusarium poae]|jgi:hypothetical protein|uniref:hypothetical protein n=1 Tax=Fusarium poae TaxID=36050 RepID=UPI001CE73233|nr:hypothetical protein FPOAC1_003623 [Fusarium poae]KAG8677599.1 hypothetical protein FPOAC1_003623 [Fusarium poae]
MPTDELGSPKIKGITDLIYLPYNHPYWKGHRSISAKFCSSNGRLRVDELSVHNQSQRNVQREFRDAYGLSCISLYLGIIIQSGPTKQIDLIIMFPTHFLDETSISTSDLGHRPFRLANVTLNHAFPIDVPGGHLAKLCPPKTQVTIRAIQPILGEVGDHEQILPAPASIVDEYIHNPMSSRLVHYTFSKILRDTFENMYTSG